MVIGVLALVLENDIPAGDISHVIDIERGATYKAWMIPGM